MTKVWRKNITICPINKRVHFLCELGSGLYEIVGTLTLNPYNATVIRGECIEGDPDIFYRSDIIGWAEYLTDEEAEAMIL